MLVLRFCVSLRVAEDPAVDIVQRSPDRNADALRRSSFCDALLRSDNRQACRPSSYTIPCQSNQRTSECRLQSPACTSPTRCNSELPQSPQAQGPAQAENPSDATSPGIHKPDNGTDARLRSRDVLRRVSTDIHHSRLRHRQVPEPSRRRC